MHDPLAELEKQLDKLLGKWSPYKVSANSKKTLASVAWWVCLIIGIVQLWAAWSFWQLGHAYSAVASYANYLNGTLNGTQIVPNIGFTYYLAFFVLIADAALLLLAVPALKAYRKHGWDLVYYSLLLNVVYAFIRIFSATGGGFGQFIVELFISAIFAYFLFQIKQLFSSTKDSSKDNSPS